jgi:staphyloferrin B biosynthesis citrate synthase
MRAARSFREKFAAGERLLGSFIKNTDGRSVEILGLLGVDFVVIDEEHAPFDRLSIDICLLAARAGNVAGLVRVADASDAKILSALDCGATGILVPHVADVKIARSVAAAARYRNGRRGFSNSPRAGHYGGAGMADHIAQSDRAVTVIAMIEDAEALTQLDDIVAVDGIDGFFVGRGDLAVALNAAGPNAPEITEAVERICAAARKVSKPVCVMVGGAGDIPVFLDKGVTAFIVSSDQGLMKQAAKRVVDDFAKLIAPQAN